MPSSLLLVGCRPGVRAPDVVVDVAEDFREFRLEAGEVGAAAGQGAKVFISLSALQVVHVVHRDAHAVGVAGAAVGLAVIRAPPSRC